MSYAKDFIIASLNFIILVLISFFAGAPSTVAGEVGLRPIIGDSKTRFRTIPQQLAQNQPEDLNQDPSSQSICPVKPKTEFEAEESPLPDLNEQTIQVEKIEVTGNTIFEVEIQNIIKCLGEKTTLEKLEETVQKKSIKSPNFT